MSKVINHWYDFNLIVAIFLIIMIIIQKGTLNFTQRVLLFEFAFFNLHLWEEYDHPGDRPGTINVAIYHNRKTPAQYPDNQLSAIICNYPFGLIIWLVPVWLPKDSWLVMGAIMWGLIEFGLHLIYYPHKTHSTLNGGFITSLVGFVPCGIIYLFYAHVTGALTLINVLTGIIYATAWYVLLFKFLGIRVLATHHPRFPFTVKQLVKYVKTVKYHQIHHHKPGELW